MESALYGVYTLVVLYQKSHSFASLTCSISDTPQLVCKHRTRALSMKYSIMSYASQHIFFMFRIIITVSLFIHLLIQSEHYNIVREQRTVQCVFTTTLQRRTVLFIFHFCIISQMISMYKSDPKFSLGLI